MMKTRQFLKTLLLIIGTTFTQFSINAQSELFIHNSVSILSSTLTTSYSSTVKNVFENSNNNNKRTNFISNSLGIPKRAFHINDKYFKIKRYYLDRLLASEKYNGNLSNEGVYYLKGENSDYYKIYCTKDLNPKSDSYTFFYEKEKLSKKLNIDAFAFNKLDGHLYTVEKNTNHLYKINPETNRIIDLGEVPILSGFNYNYTDISFDSEGFLYVKAKQTGSLYLLLISLNI